MRRLRVQGLVFAAAGEHEQALELLGRALSVALTEISAQEYLLDGAHLTESAIANLLLTALRSDFTRCSRFTQSFDF